MDNRTKSELIVSIIICTFNRPGFIERSARSVLRQKVPFSTQFEVIVVDNGNDDETPKIIAKLKSETVVCNILYTREARQGLHWARNTGVANSRGQILAFIDDDAEAQDGWLNAMIETYLSTDADCVIGRHKTKFIGEVPDWLKKQNIYVKKENLLGDKIKLIKKQTLIGNGLNMSMRREVYNKIGGFRALFPQRIWEDVIFFQEAQKLKFKIYYNPNMKVVHFLLSDRISEKKIENEFYWGARSRCLIDKEFYNSSTIFFNITKRALFYLFYPILNLIASLLSVRHKALLWRCYFLDSKGYLEQLIK